MWPSLPASGRASFSEVSCPQGPSCTFPNCFFRHEVPDRPPPRPPTTMATQVPPAPSLPGPNTESAQTPESRPSAAPRASTTPSASTAPSTSTAARTSTTSSTSTAPKASTASRTSTAPTASAASNASTSSRTSIAPSASTTTRASTALPSSSSNAATAKPTANSDAPVNLRPLQLAKAPAVYTRRAALLQALHDALKKHNDKMTKARDPDTRALHLNENQLKQLAIDEEAEIAISHRSVYENILKQRIVKLKTMPPEAWAKERRAAIAGDTPEDNRVETGLSPEDEITFVRTMVCNQEDLRLCNYVTRSPSEAEVKETRLALDAAAGWEMCDRCKTRFQVFPDRNEQGKLTTGGECTFHWGKYDRFKEQHTCCGREMGSQGCTTHDTHVFSFKDPKRLAVVMPFIHTPENDQIPKSSAVSCDCEMGYTTSGFELLRLTVLSWPQHGLLVDVLVRPFGKILDFNTRFSGVTKDQFVSAKAYDPANPRPVGKELRIVESPRVARELFLSHVSPETPIIGHGLENDLNVIRLIHPLILDTGILYQTKRPLPIRLPLRVLAKDHLHEDIQQAGEAGHDSYEDSRAAGELVRLKVKKLWARDKADGWKFRDGGVHPPTPPRSLRQPPPSADTRSMAPTANMTGSMATRPATKRKLEDDEEGDSTVPPAKKLLMQMLGTKKCDL